MRTTFLAPYVFFVMGTKRNPSEWTPTPALQAAYRQLLDAHYYAISCALPKADFAISLAELLAIGVTINDLRWLHSKAYLEHVVETSPPCAIPRRRFRRPGSVFSSRSCFVVTDEGRSFIERQHLNNRIAPSLGSEGSVRTPVAVPRWDKVARRLWFNGTVIKEFKVPAANQETILATFEDDHWPSSIDDPLPPIEGIDPKRRLHYTIIRLNKSHRRRVIRFHGNGNGKAVFWQAC